MTRAERARARHAAARDLRSRAAHGAVSIDQAELVSLLGSGDDAQAPRLAAATLRAHGLRPEPELPGAAPDAPVRLAPRRMLAVQGAVVAGLAATAFGAARLWIYGALFALAALASVGLLAARAEVAERVLPDVVPRGRWAGAALTAMLTVAVGLVVAVPVHVLRGGRL